MGDTGASTGVHLHIGVKPSNEDIFINPESESLMKELASNGKLFLYTKRY